MLQHVAQRDIVCILSLKAFKARPSEIPRQPGLVIGNPVHDRGLEIHDL